MPSKTKNRSPQNTSNFFRNILKKEISIRGSLVLFYLILITFVSITIIVVNQQILNRVLVSLTQRIMQDTGAIVQAQIEDYLEPLTYDLTEAASLISENVINPDSTIKFKHYLLELVKPNPQEYGAYWATPQGDYFAVKREPNNTFQVWHLERSKNPPEHFQGTMDIEGNLGNIITGFEVNYDPRTRPWYDLAIKNNVIWTGVYQFAFQTEGISPYGITAARAVYDANHNLRGVFGIDITIQELVDFIRKIKVSKNSIVLVTDRNNYLIAAQGNPELEQAIGNRLTPSLFEKLKIPYSLEDIFFKHPIFGKVYKYSNSNDYFAIQKKLNLGNDNDWKVLIVVPEKDILGPLRVAGLISLLSTLVILMIGILIANAISQRITKPINRIVREAEAIQKLELDKIILVPTHIKEIRILTSAFDTMKKGLQSFGRYVPTQLIRKLFETGKIAHVGGDMKSITTLFSDIQNFTPLIERLPPEEVMNVLYEYLDAMTKIVLTFQGTIDKYVGDLVMAFWGAPLLDEYQADHACQSALQMLETLKKLNEKWHQANFEEVYIRIGINTGLAIVGNVGSSERLNYTALGDSVNLASRLEEANKLYGTRIIITEATVKVLKTQFPIRLLDRVTVRGKENDIKIYELGPANFSLYELQKYNKSFEEAFDFYQHGKWQEALEAFYNLWKRYPHDQLTKIFIHRCELLIKHNPIYWDGIWRLD